MLLKKSCYFLAYGFISDHPYLRLGQPGKQKNIQHDIEFLKVQVYLGLNTEHKVGQIQ